jgi:hypothetical protein
LKPERPAADLASYYNSEHLILQAYVAKDPVAVAITPYALERMKQRDIENEDIVSVLAMPRSSHGRGKTPGRFEAVGETLRGRVRVVYERKSQDLAVIITAFRESE